MMPDQMGKIHPDLAGKLTLRLFKKESQVSDFGDKLRSSQRETDGWGEAAETPKLRSCCKALRASSVCG